MLKTFHNWPQIKISRHMLYDPKIVWDLFWNRKVVQPIPGAWRGEWVLGSTICGDLEVRSIIQCRHAAGSNAGRNDICNPSIRQHRQASRHLACMIQNEVFFFLQMGHEKSVYLSIVQCSCFAFFIILLVMCMCALPLCDLMLDFECFGLHVAQSIQGREGLGLLR
jgi:hypothetical protein